jgi:hypothetical protein
MKLMLFFTSAPRKIASHYQYRVKQKESRLAGECIVRGSRPPSFIFRRHGDGKPDVIFFDFKRQGKWELSYCAENFDSHWTLVGYHDDGSLKPSKFESSAVGTEPAAYRLTAFRQVSGEAASICRRRCRERFQAAIRRIAPQPAALAKNTDAIVQSCWFTPGARTFILG